MGCRVLLVEDNALVTDALTILLESGGHTVRIAASVAEAVARGREAPVDILLLDLTLPDGDGLDALRQLREAGAMPTVAVALTGHDDPRIAARAEAAGCRTLLLKPVPTRELMARLAAWEGEIRSASGSPPA